MAGLGIGLIVAIAIGVVAIGIILWAIGVYNKLVTLRERFKNAFSQIDVQLKRRYDLIPNLVETAKGYMSHERETLEAVIEARNQAHQIQVNLNGDPTDAAQVAKLAGADQALNSALGRLMAVAEAYPDLKANENMLSLQEELTSTENKISFARQGYNDVATTYNTYKGQFPPNVVAGMFGFTRAELWEIAEADAAQRENVKVSF